jgi:hypothetical protein
MVSEPGREKRVDPQAVVGGVDDETQGVAAGFHHRRIAVVGRGVSEGRLGPNETPDNVDIESQCP